MKLLIKFKWTIKFTNQFHKLIKEKFTNLFSKLPEYSRYMKRVKKLSYLAYKLIEEFSHEERDEMYIIDTKPIPLIGRERTEAF